MHARIGSAVMSPVGGLSGFTANPTFGAVPSFGHHGGSFVAEPQVIITQYPSMNAHYPGIPNSDLPRPDSMRQGSMPHPPRNSFQMPSHGGNNAPGYERYPSMHAAANNSNGHAAPPPPPPAAPYPPLPSPAPPPGATAHVSPFARSPSAAGYAARDPPRSLSMGGGAQSGIRVPAVGPRIKILVSFLQILSILR